MPILRLILAATLFFGAPSLALAEPAKAVVELFTSQGCSSCPPADAQLEALASRPDIVALAYHVDYWDYLGWKDTLGTPIATQRQRAYAASRGERQVFTPQFIVNGSRSLSGSELKSAVAGSGLPVAVDIDYIDEKLQVSLSGDGPGAKVRGATVRLVTLKSKAVVDVARGENAGKRITYANVVIDVAPIGMWDGKPLTITLPSDEVLAGGADACAILVQMDRKGSPGEILGAAWIADDD
jgi:hypothetical protein